MQCREAVFAEDVLIYVVDNYRGEGYVREVYNPDCLFGWMTGRQLFTIRFKM